MNTQIKEDFISKWEKHFPNAELPIACYYSDELNGASFPDKPAENNKGYTCILTQFLKVRRGESLAFNAENLGCVGSSSKLGFTPSVMNDDLVHFLTNIECSKINRESVISMCESNPAVEKKGKYLAGKDKRLAEVIKKVGHIYREVNPDLFGSLIHSIIGQQISTKAHATIWLRMVAGLGEITPKSICAQTPEHLQSYGLSFRKVEYMQSVSQKIENGEFSISAFCDMSDEEVCYELSKLNGIGVGGCSIMYAEYFI